MKISITSAHREQLTVLRGQLATALESIHSADGKYSRLTDSQQKLQAEVAALENEDSASEAAASKLATKRVQLERVSGQLEELSSQPASSSLGADQSLLREFARVATAALAPAMEAYAAVVADKLRPWCLNQTEARAFAFRVPAVLSLCQTYSQRFGDFGGNAAVLKSALDRADEILSGELKWSWDAKIAK